MKLQAILALCLLGAAFAAPIDSFVDPDCIEEDSAVEEPVQEIDAEFALGVPDLIIDVAQAPNNDEECEDEPVSEEPMLAPTTEEAECEEEITTEEVFAAAPTEAAEEECEDPITTEEAPAMAPTTEAECVEEITTDEAPMAAPTTESDECEDEGNEAGPEIDIRIEPAQQIQEFMVYSPGEEQAFNDVEECEE